MAMVAINTGMSVPRTEKDDEGEDQRRHGQQEIDDPRQRDIDPAPEHGRGEPAMMPIVKDRQVMTSGQPDRHAAAVQHAAEDVAADLIEPNQYCGRDRKASPTSSASP